MLKMCSAISVAFFLSKLPFVVKLPVFFFIQRLGKVCLPIDFLFVTVFSSL